MTNRSEMEHYSKHTNQQETTSEMTEGLHASPPIQFYRTDLIIFIHISKSIVPSTVQPTKKPIDANTTK